MHLQWVYKRGWWSVALRSAQGSGNVPLGQQHWLFWSSLGPRPPILHLFPAHCRCHTNTAVLLVALLKSKRKTTCRFLKSCMWLRKLRVGMRPCNPLIGVERKQIQRGLQMPPMPLPAKFCISFSSFKISTGYTSEKA